MPPVHRVDPMVADKPDELATILGRALVQRRWVKATKEQRSAHGTLMVNARWARYRARLEAEGKPLPKPRKRRRRPK